MCKQAAQARGDAPDGGDEGRNDISDECVYDRLEGDANNKPALDISVFSSMNGYLLLRLILNESRIVRQGDSIRPCIHPQCVGQSKK